MDTASFQFVVFGLAAALLSNLSRARAWRSAVLAAASIFFLVRLAPHPIVLLPLVGFLLLGYAALAMQQRGWSRTLAASIVTVVFAYIWLKKYTFLPESIFLTHPYFTLGLSYIFFRVLHLIIDAGDRGQSRRLNFGAYLLYTLNFTTLVSGPIQQYDEFSRDQFAPTPLPLGPRVIGLQIERIVRGFFKVNVLAMLLSAAQQDALSEISQSLPAPLRCFAAIRLALLYPLFLYCNFSGYIDIVVAIARLMRLRLPENFDRPFSASSVLDFWNQWHITLSTWLKTYVYNPLLVALMRRISSLALQPLLGVFCFFVTFFLIGLWHGRTSEFIFFGLLTGGGVSVNKLWQLQLSRWMGRKSYKAFSSRPAYVAFGRGLNFGWFGFTLFWFWGTWQQVGKVFHSLNAVQWACVWLAAWLFATIVLDAWERLRAALLSIRSAEGPLLTSRYARVVYASALALIAFVMTFLLNQPAPDIVYKAF